MEAKKSKSESRKRKDYFGVRLSKEEKEEFDRRCKEAGLNASDYFKKACLEVKPLRKFRQKTIERELLITIEIAINRIGGNVNQIAAKVNSSGFMGKEELRKLQEQIIETHKIVESLLPKS